MEHSPPENGFTGLIHSLPQMSQKKLNEKPLSVELSQVFLVIISRSIITIYYRKGEAVYHPFG
uniref:Uncharacterized protein n=1 Tax=uncultured bacterium contig00037 TaxID=1181525 RepID=A0A806KFE7_9BACT|nr:hypothetical protein [uncultured bacterium contig00037]